MSVPAGNPSNLKHFWTVTQNKSLYVLKWDTDNLQWFYLKCGRLVAVNFSMTYQDTEGIKYIVFKLTVEEEGNVTQSSDMGVDIVNTSFELPPVKVFYVVQESLFIYFGENVIKNAKYLNHHPKTDLKLLDSFKKGIKKTTGNWLKIWLQTQPEVSEEPSFLGTPPNTKTHSST